MRTMSHLAALFRSVETMVMLSVSTTRMQTSTEARYNASEEGNYTGPSQFRNWSLTNTPWSKSDELKWKLREHTDIALRSFLEEEKNITSTDCPQAGVNHDEGSQTRESKVEQLSQVEVADAVQNGWQWRGGGGCINWCGVHGKRGHFGEWLK